MIETFDFVFLSVLHPGEEIKLGKSFQTQRNSRGFDWSNFRPDEYAKLICLIVPVPTISLHTPWDGRKGLFDFDFKAPSQLVQLLMALLD